MTIDHKIGWRRQLSLLFEVGASGGSSDEELVQRFARGDGETAEIAFTALVTRHGPLVLRACRAVLRDRHEAEDALQATFLVLARKADSIAVRGSLAPWLLQVARHVSLRANAASARRRHHESRRPRLQPAQTGGFVEETREITAILLEEVSRLPSRYQTPVVLCYLEGLTCESAAWQLGLPVGTVKSRLARGRARLRLRLTRLGVAPGIVIGAIATSTARAAMPDRLISTTTRWAISIIPRSARPVATIPEHILSLTSATSRSMTMIAIRRIVAAVAIAAVAWLSLAPAAPGPEEPENRDRPTPARRRPVDARPPRRLIPEALGATAGRGGVLIYELDSRNERKVVSRDPGQRVRYRETVRDLRWIAVIGTLDNPLGRGGQAWSTVPDLTPNYRRVDLERQTRHADGGWSAWSPVEREKNYMILDNLPENGTERTRSEVRTGALVDPLPMLKSGTLQGVDVEKFVDRRPPADGRSASPTLQNADVPELMIRSFDFSVGPGTFYRYRARVVITVPALNVIGVESFGPWSEPTNEVEVPRE